MARESVDIYAALAGASERVRLMNRVVRFKSVSTRFISFNRASGIGGMPLSCIGIFHGPSTSGKTVLAVECMRSVLDAGGYALFVDAELAAETSTWFTALGVDTSRCLYLGRVTSEELVDHKVKPLTYEEIQREVNGFIERFTELRRQKVIPPGTPAIIVVDSMSKLVPESFLKDFEDAKDGGDSLRKGVGRTQALMNAAWLLGLGPRIGDDDLSFIGIAHEYDDASGNAMPWSDPKVKGGNAMIFDSMLVARVTFAGKVTDLSADDAPQTGKVHRVIVRKNKHASGSEFAYFFTSNGRGIAPLGADVWREAVLEGLSCGLLEGPTMDKTKKGKIPKLTIGTQLSWQKKKFKLGDLYKNDDLFGSLREKLSVIASPSREE